MTPSKFLYAAALLFAFQTRTVHAEATWTEIRSPHFRVLTDGSAQQGRDVATQFEQMRHIFELRFNDQNIGSGAPLTIIAAHDVDTFRTLEPREWKATSGNLAGEFHRGWEKQFATVILGTFEQGQIVVFHEYTHSVLHARAHWLPVWMDEGLAEFYGYTRFQKDKTLVGAPSIRSGILRQRSLLPVSEMLDTTNEARLLRDPEKAQLFYAEAWAMVHYMIFGKDMNGGARLNALFKKLQDGEKEKDAFTEVFGDPHAFDNALNEYVMRFAFLAGVFPADEKIDPKSFPDHRLTPAETQYELGCFQIGAHEPVLGRARIEKAIQLDPKLAGAYEELAFLDFRDGKDAEAVKGWQQAVDLDPTRTRSIFALAMMDVPLREATSPQLLATREKLQHVLQLSPGFAPAHVDLALVDWRLGHLQDAYNEVREAEKLEPWRAGYHILRGQILLAGQKPNEAATVSRFVAERWHGPDHNEAVDLWNRLPAGNRGDGAPLDFDMPQGTKVERGTLTGLTCGTGPSAPTVITFAPDSPGAPPLTFKSDGRFMVGFSDSFWWGEDHFTMCHHLTGHPAVIAYKPEDQHLLDLEVRDDLPAPAGANRPATASTP